MSLKLFTIGDSVSQGFMSGAAARPEYCYSTLLAEVLGMPEFSNLQWEDGKRLKYDLEQIFRRLDEKFYKDISLINFPSVIRIVNSVLDESEDYYERGNGEVNSPVLTNREWFHNVSVEGMDVADAWLVTPRVCYEHIKALPKKEKKDNYLKNASAPFYRNAHRVLNPKNLREYDDYSPIKWLEHHATKEGVENTIIWLGANNALGTIIDLDIKQSPNNPNKLPWEHSREERDNWSLWHREDFEKEYFELARQVDAIMMKNKDPNWKVFIGTVPYVTIAPIAKGLGEARDVKGEGFGLEELSGRYYQYYGYYLFDLEDSLKKDKYLKFKDALFIDKTIAQYNRIIKDVVNRLNNKHGEERYIIVDTCKALKEMAWKRNLGEPTYEFPEYIKEKYPTIDTKFYDVRNGEMYKGGLFSLDGIHPTAIGQGIIAWEFLKKMKDHKVVAKDDELNWEQIYKNDSLYQKPIRSIRELHENREVISVIADIISKGKK